MMDGGSGQRHGETRGRKERVRMLWRGNGIGTDHAESLRKKIPGSRCGGRGGRHGDPGPPDPAIGDELFQPGLGLFVSVKIRKVLIDRSVDLRFADVIARHRGGSHQLFTQLNTDIVGTKHLLRGGATISQFTSDIHHPQCFRNCQVFARQFGRGAAFTQLFHGRRCGRLCLSVGHDEEE
ncbi:hypothetical protein RB5217 [Rhodopirellula baltica SH 1]|uniref:Uncharacterized protein n=1 Tax=Rhodopirellula baltica (strain DSM 10527 / NCIMB 13988 / SH1) TaxID=243090 RepID=Q7UGH4_RHOBA|nr:hypothetical protein RB5217 [Rhodopirellula baltica SH 1]